MKIKSRFNGQVIYESQGETMRETVIEAVGQGADLREADLQGADLQGADLRCANLREVDLRCADLQGADLRCAHGCIVLPVGDPRGYCSVAAWTAAGWRIFSGCRSFSPKQALSHWGAGYHGDREIGDRYVYAINWLLQKYPVDPSITCSIQRRHVQQLMEAA